MPSIINNTKTEIADAKFSFNDYKFTNVSINFGVLTEIDNLTIEFKPSGEYNPQSGLFQLTMRFMAYVETPNELMIDLFCVADFQFNESLEFEYIPLYFYSNSTAILYPYVRSFVSTLSLQANYNPIVLPTLNISSLAEELKERTVVNHTLDRIKK